MYSWVVIVKDGQDKYGAYSCAVGPFDSECDGDEWIEAQERKRFGDQYEEYVAEWDTDDPDDQPQSFDDWMCDQDSQPWEVDHYHCARIRTPDPESTEEIPESGELRDTKRQLNRLQENYMTSEERRADTMRRAVAAEEALAKLKSQMRKAQMNAMPPVPSLPPEA